MTGRNKTLYLGGVCALLGLLALLWTALHFEWQAKGEAVTLPASSALGRAGERLSLTLPTGGVNVNTATVDELCTLRGIGKSLAAAIIAERELNGPFVFPEDLLGVKGIGEKKLAEFAAQIRLE